MDVRKVASLMWKITVCRYGVDNWSWLKRSGHWLYASDASHLLTVSSMATRHDISSTREVQLVLSGVGPGDIPRQS